MNVVNRLEELDKWASFLQKTLTDAEQAGKSEEQKKQINNLCEQASKFSSSIRGKLELWKEYIILDPSQKGSEWESRSQEVELIRADIEKKLVIAMQDINLPTWPTPPKPLPGATDLTQTSHVSDPDILIGQNQYWDCDVLCETFVTMIKGNRVKGAFRVLALQGEAGELDSLITRFKEMWQTIGQRAPRGSEHLHVHLILGSGVNKSELASQIVRGVENDCDNSGLNAVEEGLAKLRGQKIVPLEEKEQRQVVISQTVLACALSDCLKVAAAEDRTVVVVLQGFEKLADTPAGRWLLDYWIKQEAPKVPGLVVVITGEQGLDSLARLNMFGIIHFHVPPMTFQDYGNWARLGFGLLFFSDEDAQILHSNPDFAGKAGPFRVFLTALQILENAMPGSGERMIRAKLEVSDAQASG